ncbi:unnamed protein product [Prunus armeniaca]
MSSRVVAKVHLLSIRCMFPSSGIRARSSLFEPFILGYLESLGSVPMPTCESCLQGKMSNLPFSGKRERFTELLELIHTDVCGSLSTTSRGGFSYFIMFIDDYSRLGYVYLIQYKSEAFEKFKQFKKEVEKKTGKSIKILRLDRGGEYLSTEFLEYLKKHGILSQWTPPGTPQLNGVSERRNQTLIAMVQIAAYLLNRVPSKFVPKTPYEMWFGRKPSLNHLKIWGCPAYIHWISKGKYYFYHPNEQKVFVARSARFPEIDFALDDTCVQKVELKEESGEPHEPEVEFDLVDNPVPLPTLTQPPHRSERINRAPDRYLGLHHVLLMGDGMEDPEIYTKAMLDIDSKKW